MKITLKTTPSKESQVILDSLQKAVTQALERKRGLGQYAVVWQAGDDWRGCAEGIGKPCRLRD